MFEWLLSVYGWVTIVSLVIAFIAWRRSQPKTVPDGIPTVAVTGILRPVNWVHRFLRGNFGIYFVKIKHNKHVEAAKKLAAMTDTELFGPQDDFVRAVELISSNDNYPKEKMSASGRIMMDSWIGKLIACRQEAMNYIQNHREEILKAKLVKPIIISGLPRTGSTMLYNLMSCDPASRVPLLFELSASLDDPYNCPKSREERDTDKRIKLVDEDFDRIEKNYPGFFTEAAKSHRTYPTELEEDVFLFFHSLVMPIHVNLSCEEYRKFYEDPDNKKCTYIYHRLFLQMMNAAWTPDSHWVLKSPIHGTYMDEMMEQFPDAQVVFTHRNPESVVPSFAKLIEGYMHWLFEDRTISKVVLGKHIYDSVKLLFDRIKVWREKTDHKVYFDVIYSDFTKDPIGTVENIYKHFGRVVTDEFRENMKEWIATNRQGKYGRRTYTMEEFGFTPESLAQGFPNYPECFRE